MPAPATPEIAPLSQLAGPGGWRLGLQHTCDDHLLIRLTRVNGHAVLRGVRLALTQHSAIFIPAGTLFSLDAGPQGMGMALRIPPEADILLPDSAHRLRITKVQDQTALARLFDAMLQEQTSGTAFRGAAARAHTTLIAIWLRRALLDQPPLPDPPPDQRLSIGFADLLARDGPAGRPLTDYAAALGIGAAHLSRCCKSACGLSAADMVTERRLHSARTLLADTDHTVGKIASHLGFRSAAYFTRFIAKHTGRTPSDIRQIVRAMEANKS